MSIVRAVTSLGTLQMRISLTYFQSATLGASDVEEVEKNTLRRQAKSEISRNYISLSTSRGEENEGDEQRTVAKSEEGGKTW